ncbi:MAG: hypothetical protein PHT51_03565 [Patescibacteria group bacterium]|nr:hypothetical protein [Patescibacteria group bacterium]MDD4610962.1 hypothetical protein [Patescibacteria group bacterium]
MKKHNGFSAMAAMLFAMAMFFSISLTACSGGRGEPGKSTTTPAVPQIVQAVWVIDGPIQLLQAFLDINGDWTLSANTETAATTDANGKVALVYTQGVTGVLVANGHGVDTLTGYDGNWLLGAPQNSSYITPVTTLVARGMESADALALLGATGYNPYTESPLNYLPLYRAGAKGDIMFRAYATLLGSDPASEIGRLDIVEQDIADGKIVGLMANALAPLAEDYGMDVVHAAAFAAVLADMLEEISDAASQADVVLCQQAFYTKVLPAIRSFVAGKLDEADFTSGFTGDDLHAVIYGGVVTNPIANAGPDQTVVVNSVVTLDASASTGVVDYKWLQTSGIAMTLNSDTVVKPTFVAPATDATLVFTMTGTGANGTNKSDTVTITVTSGGTVHDDDVTLNANGTLTINNWSSHASGAGWEMVGDFNGWGNVGGAPVVIVGDVATVNLGPVALLEGTNRFNLRNGAGVWFVTASLSATDRALIERTTSASCALGAGDVVMAVSKTGTTYSSAPVGTVPCR